MIVIYCSFIVRITPLNNKAKFILICHIKCNIIPFIIIILILVVIQMSSIGTSASNISARHDRISSFMMGWVEQNMSASTWFFRKSNLIPVEFCFDAMHGMWYRSQSIFWDQFTSINANAISSIFNSNQGILKVVDKLLLSHSQHPFDVV